METLEYDLSLEDHLDWSVHTVKQSSVFRRSLLGWRFVPPVFFLLAYLIPVSRVLARTLSLLEGAELALIILLSLIPIIMIDGLWIIWYPRAAEKRVRKTMERWFKESPARMHGRTSLRVTAEGITESTELERHQAEWKAVEKMEQTDSHVYIWLPGGKAFILPGRAFGDDATYRRFMEDVERFRSSEADSRRSDR